MTPEGRPTVAVVDLGAIRANVRVVKAAISPGTALWAVVKADAYGHGAVAVARAALQAGADHLAVALPEEGALLRRAGVTARILVMGALLPHQLGAVVADGLESIAFSRDHVRDLAAEVERQGTTAAVHLKLDTGMGRVGIPSRGPADVWAVVALAREIARGAPALRWAGIMTHLAGADDPEPASVERQYDRLLRVVSELSRNGLHAPVHLSNSAAALRFPGLNADGVRVGLALYGLVPYPGAPALTPAMTLVSAVTMVKRVDAGFAVGYGHTYRTPSPAQIVTVAAGYADGVRRGLSNRGEALVAGRRVPMVGRVSMDQLTLSVPLKVPVAVGDPVVLLGRQGGAAVTAEDWAGWLDTISYEVVCGISGRVPRLYVEGPDGPADWPVLPPPPLAL